MNATDNGVDELKEARICVFISLRRWSLGQWAYWGTVFLSGLVVLVSIGYATWIGVRTQRVEIAIAIVAILPWCLLFGRDSWWLLKSFCRGGHPLVLLVSEHAMALGMNDEGSLARAFDAPTLRETKDELIVKDSYIVARLPKNQLSMAQADLIRRCCRNTSLKAKQGMQNHGDQRA